jgi:hypothetical protein
MTDVCGQHGQGVPYGILTHFATDSREPGNAQVFGRMKLAQALFVFCMSVLGKNKNNARHYRAAAHGPSGVPVQGRAPPMQKLLGAAVSGGGKAAALPGRQKYGPGLDLPWEGDGTFRHD